MKKTLLTLAIVAMSAFAVNAQDLKAPAKTDVAPVNPNAAEMVFETDVHDFGTIPNAGNGTYEFKFKNTGKEPLIISNAQGSCGCTVPSWPKEPIKPGDSNVIKVTYDTKRPGAFTKTVTLTSNSKTPTKVITIKGNVEPAPVEEAFPAKPAVKNVGPVEKQN